MRICTSELLLKLAIRFMRRFHIAARCDAWRVHRAAHVETTLYSTARHSGGNSARSAASSNALPGYSVRDGRTDSEQWTDTGINRPTHRCQYAKLGTASIAYLHM